MSSSRAVATSTLWQFGSQMVMALFSIATTKFVAIGLSQELAGHYNTAYGYLQLFGILADFGLYGVAVREVSRAENRERILGALIVLRGGILSLSLMAALLFAWIIPLWHGTPLPLSITIAAFVPFFTLLAGILRTSFQVTYKMHFVFIAEVAQRVVTTLFIGLFIFAGVRDSLDERYLYAFLGIGGFGAGVLFLFSLLYGKRIIAIRPRWDPPLLRHLLRQAAPFGIAFLCTALYRQFDVTLIALLRADFEIQNAYYGFVQRGMDMAYLLPTFLLNSTLPILARGETSAEDTKNFLGKTLLAILLISTTAFLFSFFWSRPLMHLLTREIYLSTATQTGSDTALQILGISMFFNGLILFASYSLLTLHRWKPLVTILSLGVILSLTLNILLIPSLGFIGASITSAITHAFLALFLLPQSLRIAPIRMTRRELVQWTSYSVFLLAGIIVLRPFLTNSPTTLIGLGIMGLWIMVIAEVFGLRRAFVGNPRVTSR